MIFNRYWHVSRNFAALAAADDGAGVQEHELSPSPFHVQPGQRTELDRILGECGTTLAHPLAVLNPNAGSLALERRWPADRFASLAARLLTHPEWRCVFVGSPSERASTARVATAARVAVGKHESRIRKNLL